MPDEPYILLDMSERAQRVREQMASPEVVLGMRRQQSRITVTIDMTTGEVTGSGEAMSRYRNRNPDYRPAPSKTGLKGVHVSGKKWRSMIERGGKRYYLGTFDTPELAHAAYLEAVAQWNNKPRS